MWRGEDVVADSVEQGLVGRGQVEGGEALRRSDAQGCVRGSRSTKDSATKRVTASMEPYASELPSRALSMSPRLPKTTRRSTCCAVCHFEAAGNGRTDISLKKTVEPLSWFCRPI